MSKYLRFDAKLHMKDLLSHLIAANEYTVGVCMDETGERYDYDLTRLSDRLEMANDICAVEYMNAYFKVADERFLAVTFMPYEGAGWNSIMDFTDNETLNKALTSFCDPLEG